jgi:hypothetical protein
MVWTFIDTLCKYTTCICRTCGLVLDVIGRLLIAMAGRLVVVGWRCCCLEDCWECCSVKPDEVREWVDSAGSHLNLCRPAPVAGYIVTSRMCHANTRSALLDCNLLTGLSHRADWSVFRSQSWSYFTTVSQYVLVLSTLVGLGTILRVRRLLSEICGLLSLGRPLRFNGPSRSEPVTIIYCLIWDPQPGGSGFRIYIPQEQGGPVILPGTGFPLRRLLGLIGLWWRCSKPPPTWRDRSMLGFRNRMVQSKVKSMPKSRFDRRPVDQYVLVPSPLGIRGVPSENFQFNIRRCTKFLVLPLGGLHVKHAVQRGVWVPTQHLLWDQGKPWSSWLLARNNSCI